MRKYTKILSLIFSVFFLACSTKNDDKKTLDTNKKEETKLTRDEIEIKNSKVFYLKDKIALPAAESDIFFSGENEVVLFRPTENDFGILLEETQDQNLLDLDGHFEALTNKVIINFSESENIKISICEKPIIAIPQLRDTLYFNTLKDRYGIIFSKRKDQRPSYKNAKEENLIQKIKEEYQL